MVDFTTFMGLALDKCAPSGEGTQSERQAVFADFVEVWNDNKQTIKGMTRSEARSSIECP